MTRTLCWLISLLILVPTSLWSAPLSARLQSVLTTAAEPVPVIVRLKNSDNVARMQSRSHKVTRRALITSLKQQARQNQGSLIEFLRRQGVQDPKSLWLINGLAFSASPQLIAQLQSWPGVELISADQTVPRPVVMPAAATNVEWNIDMIGAPQLWGQGIDGTGVVVAILDTGVDVDHPDLSANWRGGTNSWFDPYNIPTSALPYDTGDGHGTAVMGLLAGGNSGGSAIGVAPGAQWIAAKIFPDSGNASTTAIIQSLGWILDPDNDPATDDGADIVNNSWGFDTLTDQCFEGTQLTDFQAAFSNLRAAEIAVVFSAGNTGPLTGSSIPPGNMNGILAVGAVDRNSNVPLFSARGPSPCDAPGEVFPDLTAPGVAVRSADLTLAGTNTNPYATVSGTSFSSSHVAGALALLRQAFPSSEKSMGELEVALQEAAIDLGAQGDDDIYGSGLIDVTAAYNLLQDINPVLKISDPTVPNDDLMVDFGSVAPLSSLSLTLQLKNGGGGVVGITSVDVSTIPPEFTLANDLCSGQSLGGGEICSVDLIFAPLAFGSYDSELSVGSDDPAGPQVLTLTGQGNNAPPTPTLQLPVNGAVNVTRPVTFNWHSNADLDGDSVTDFLLISAHGDFSDSTPIDTTLPQTALLLVGSGVFWRLWRRRRLQRWCLPALFLALVLLQVSCGGGGSASTASVPLDSTGEYLSTSLQPNTTYYWKIRSEDSLGVTESSVFSFTTL